MGFIEVDQLTLRELPPEPSSPPRPIAAATSEAGVFAAAQAVDGDPETPWRSAAGGAQSLTLDLGYEREFGGVTLRWAEDEQATRYTLSTSSDGRIWPGCVEVTRGERRRRPDPADRDRRALAAAGPDGRAGGDAYALNEIEIEPLSFGEDATASVTAVAERARRGLYPRGFHGEQPYWTLVGVDGGGDSGLMGEDGAIELGRGGPSVEPFVVENGRLVTWADVGVTQSLRDDDLPIPSVRWAAEDWTLDDHGHGRGRAGASGPVRPLCADQHLEPDAGPDPGAGGAAAAGERPGAVPVHAGRGQPRERIDWDGRRLRLGEAFVVTPLSAPDAVTASTFDAGSDPQGLIALGPRTVRIRFRTIPALAAAAMTWRVTLAPGETPRGRLGRAAGGRPARPHRRARGGAGRRGAAHRRRLAREAGPVRHHRAGRGTAHRRRHAVVAGPHPDVAATGRT